MNYCNFAWLLCSFCDYWPQFAINWKKLTSSALVICAAYLLSTQHPSRMFFFGSQRDLQTASSEIDLKRIKQFQQFNKTRVVWEVCMVVQCESLVSHSNLNCFQLAVGQSTCISESTYYAFSVKHLTSIGDYHKAFELTVVLNVYTNPCVLINGSS